MADKPDKDAAETPEAETPEAEAPAEETPVAEAPAEDTSAAQAEAPTDDAEVAAEAEAPAEEAQAAEATAPAGEAEAPAEGAEVPAEAGGEEPEAGAATAEEVSPKQRRRKQRSTHSGEARPQRSPEERHAERVAERRRKAVRRRARRLQERAKAAERRASAPPSEQLAPVHAAVEGKRKVRQGVVVSNKAEKTITVRIEVARRHQRYEKIVRSSSTVHAHDENNDAREGDVVRVIESRPLSRTKTWALVDVLERAQ